MVVEDIAGLLIDVDGTLRFRGRSLPGATDLLRLVEERRLPYRLLTNIDSQTPEAIAAELTAGGLPVRAQAVFNPVRALHAFLGEREAVRCRFLLPEELVRDLGRFRWSEWMSARPDYVVLGDCRSCVDYDSLNEAFRDLLSGAELVALQLGRHYWRADGAYVDTGAFARLLEYAAGVTSLGLGKPSPAFFRLALSDMGCEAEEVLVVGDDRRTDLAGARSIGARAALVRTGRFEAAAPGDAEPDLLLANLEELVELLAASSPAAPRLGGRPASPPEERVE